MALLAVAANVPTFLHVCWRWSECVDGSVHPMTLTLLVHHCFVSLQSPLHHTTILSLVERPGAICHILCLAN